MRFVWMGCEWNMFQNLNNLAVLEELGTDDADCHKKVVVWRRVATSTRSLVNARGLQLECARVLHEALFVPVLMYGSETIIRAVQIVNLRGLLGIRRMDKVQNVWIRELYGEM